MNNTTKKWAKNNPWSKPIDYDKAIADDLRQIALCERAIAFRWIYPSNLIAGYGISVVDLIVYATVGDRQVVVDENVASPLGFSREDVACMFAFTNPQKPEGPYLDLCNEAEAVTGWFRKGEAAYKRVTDLYPSNVETEEKLLQDIKKAKASLARHRRNKIKYGNTK